MNIQARNLSGTTDKTSHSVAYPQIVLRHEPLHPEDLFFRFRDRTTRQAQKAEQQPEAETRLCPNASCESVAMLSTKVEEMSIDRCPECGGVFLEADEMTHLVSETKCHNSLMRFFHRLAGDWDY